MSRKVALALCAELGITAAMLRERALPFHREARALVPVGLGTDGRDKLLRAPAARAWLAMRQTAAQEGVALLLISAFRSYAFQAALIRQKLDKGRSLAEVLTVNAPPGFSEHHGGQAIDIGAAGCAALDEAFENTEAFAWLRERAAGFGFAMSYPRGNTEGFLYEPWHWCWHTAASST